MKKILIIEDDVFLNKAYQTKFSLSNLDVVFAYDGEEGFKKVSLEKPDLILLDLMLPKKSGFEIMEEMQKIPDLKKIPVLILSNLGQEDDVKRAMELGAKGYFIKSDVKLETVVEKVKEHIK